MNNYTDKKLLTHFPIGNMMEELEINKVSKSRRNEIVKAYKKYLSDDEYYCISANNPIKSKLMTNYSSKCVVVNNFKFGYTGSIIYLSGGEIEFNGHAIKTIIQRIEPKTSHDFQHLDDYTVLYFSKKDIDYICEELI